jgi:hypothetical protein
VHNYIYKCLPDNLAVTVQLKDIGSGNFGVAKLMRYKPTGELVAVKFIERGDKVSRKQCASVRLPIRQWPWAPAQASGRADAASCRTVQWLLTSSSAAGICRVCIRHVSAVTPLPA